MSSDDLENAERGAKPMSERLLMTLKTRGDQTSSELGAILSTTGENARQHLSKLASAGLVSSYSEAQGVGRPAQRWRLTDAGQRRFPDTHAELTVQLLQIVRTVLGPSSLEQIVQAREAETRLAYETELTSLPRLRDRVARLAEIRSREGYMAEWSEDSDGAYVLIENHCPICAAAATCQGLCRGELAVFQQVLGTEVSVVRTEHILSGARRCAYRITPESAMRPARVVKRRSPRKPPPP